jgi:PhzF family phenazine biosynthesis protein
MKCKLFDVFSNKKLSGNGLTVFYDYECLNSTEMLSWTQEMRQFESIFVSSSNGSYRARIFTVEEELDFAGHPIIGLAAHLHEESGKNEQQEWTIDLNKKSVKLKTEKVGAYYHAAMEQGEAQYIYTLNKNEAQEVLLSLNLSIENLSDYPMEVVSTGLPYLIVPITSGIEKAKISVDNFEQLLARFGAKFVYVLDISAFEGRTWDNAGLVEDIATGSAAGPAAAYLTKHQLASTDQEFILSQGRFLGRASEIQVYVASKLNAKPSVWVSGDVIKVANVELV